MKKIVHFFLYNNTFILIMGGLILGAGTTMAANDDVREQVVGTLVQEQTTVVSVDNEFLITADIEQYPVTVEVVSIEEDAEFYFVTFSLNTIVIADGIWQPGVKTDTLQLEKVRLGNQDLGLYLAQEFDELITAEKQSLVETRLEEGTIGLSQKVVVTEYDGLVGRLMNSSTKVFPGYEPVIPESIATTPAESKVVAGAEFTEVANQSEEANVSESSNSSTQPDPVDTTVSSTSQTSNVSTNTNVSTTSSSTVTSSSTSTSSQPAVGTTTTSTTPTSQSAAGSTAASTSESTALLSQPDTVAPKLTLQGKKSLRLQVGEVYQESGSTAVDETDGDITSAVEITGSVDTEIPGTYIIDYSVTDQAGNNVQQKRTIEVYLPIDNQSEQETQKASTSSST